jgi:hypothetical protein
VREGGAAGLRCSFHAEARRTAEDRYGGYYRKCNDNRIHNSNYNYDRTDHYRKVFSRGGAEARRTAKVPCQGEWRPHA